MGGTAAFDQDRFRFRKDDGSLSAASWWAALNTNIVAPVGQNIRCRIAIQETAGVRASNQWLYLYYSINGGTYTAATPGSYQDSTYITDEEADNTQRLGTGSTFRGGLGNDYYYAGQSDQIDFSGSDEFEVEFCFRVPTTCTFGDTVDFRVYRYNGTAWAALNTYTNTPRVTVAGSAKSNKSFYLRGGENPTSHIDCYLTGDYPRSHIHCYAKGYEPGKDAIHLWMRGKPSSIPCYLEGRSNIKVAVVPFSARTNTGTQDITSTKLAGTSCKLALFFGVGASSYDSPTNNARIFFGATDGTSQFMRVGFGQEGYGGSQTSGTGLTTYCAGFYYQTGGYASFDSWLTGSAPGVRINWGQGAPAAYKCWALLIGAETDEAFQCKVGRWQSASTPLDGEIVNINTIGWKPNSVLFHVAHGSQLQMGLALAWRNQYGQITQMGRGADWDVGYFNSCGGWNYTDRIQGYRLDDYHWKLREFLDNGFSLENLEVGPYSDAGYYVAMRYPDDFEVTGSYTYITGTGDKTVTTGNKPLAVITNTNPADSGNYPYCNDCWSPGYMAFDDTNQEGGVANHAWSGVYVQEMRSIASQAGDLLYNESHTLDRRATRTSMNANGFTLNYSVNPGTYLMSFQFAQNKKAKSALHCYLAGHSRRQPAYARGGMNTKSSLKMFFNVVDAQSKISCFAQGLNPSRSSIPCYMMGTANAIVAVVPFTTTATSTQDITTPELGGVQPKGVLVLLQMGTLDSLDLGSQCIGLGYTDGTRSYYRTLYTQTDPTEPYTYGRRRGYGYGFVCLTNGSGGVAIKGTFNSWVTNGVRVNWTTQMGGLRGVAIFFAGSSVSTRVGTVSQNPGNTVQVTDPGFTPDLIFYAGSDGAASEESEYASAMNQGDAMLFGIAANDGYRNQFHMFWYAWGGWDWAPVCVGAGSAGARVNMGCVSGAYEPQYENPPQDQTTLIHSYDSGGFTVWYGAYAASGGSDAYFAIGFGGVLKATIDWVYLSKFAMGLTNFTVNHPNRNINPILAWLMLGQNRITETPGQVDGVDQENGTERTEFNISGFGSQDMCGPVFAIKSPFSMFTATALSQGWFQDCNWNEWSDLNAADYCSHTTVKCWWSAPYTHEWRQHFEATIPSLTLNGLSLNITKNEDKYYDYYFQYTLDETATLQWPWPLLLVGHYEEKSSIHCYMKGQKVDWRGRLPRGCYLQGAIAGTDADSSIPCYTEGAGIPVKSSTPCYLRGSDNVSSGSLIFCYARGSTSDKSSTPLYLAGLYGAKSSIPCYTRCGWDVSSSMHLYLRGDDFRSSIHCYCNGYPTTPMSSIPLYVKGAGFWPFTDNFTGSDDDPWSIKWITDKQ